MDMGKEVSVRTERAKPTMLVIDGRKMIAGGRWNDRLMANHILDVACDKPVTIGDLAKVGCGSNTIATKKRVRSYLSRLFTHMCDRGVFLVIRYNGVNGAASDVKVADLSSPIDLKCVIDKLERMRRRKEMTQEKYDKTMLVLQGLGI
jgi:hypothetical protein